MNKIHFVLGGGIYPYVTGGMEIFNYYLIKYLSKYFNISYSSYKRLKIPDAHFVRCYKIRPTKILFPLQLFIYLLCHRDIKTIILSYSAASWIVWYLYYVIFKLLHQDYMVIIHYGKKVATDHRSAYSKFFQSAQKVISVSNDIKKNYDFAFNINSTVILPLVPFEYSNFTKNELRNKYRIPLKRNVICMIGSLKDMKNPDTILKSLHDFTEDDMYRLNPHIVYAGDGAMMPVLKQFVKESQMEDRVSFLGVIPKEKINEIYKLSDIYLIASDFEGTSVSLLEAMFNKMPIITSKAPGIIDTIKEETECLMFQVKDYKELKGCVMKMLSNKDYSDRLAENAYSRFKCDYNYDNVIKKYIELFS